MCTNSYYELLFDNNGMKQFLTLRHRTGHCLLHTSMSSSFQCANESSISSYISIELHGQSLRSVIKSSSLKYLKHLFSMVQWV